MIDGGVRDVDLVNAMNYSVFATFNCPASSVGRWEIVDWQVPVNIGTTLIHPGDLVFGDTDGVVIITLEVLAAAEGIFERESGMREELRQGVSVTAA